MSNSIRENPIFASEYVSSFTHYAEIDEELRENIEMEKHKDLKLVIFPIIDQIPEKSRGIVRIFISNDCEQPLTISTRFSVIGWFSDLSKKNKSKKIEKITINPQEVWFRDVSFVSDIKQGKNYFKLIINYNRKEHITTHIEFSQIREIDDEKQIERSNYLGMLSKAYINPKSLNYWIYFSIFGPYKYKKERNIFIILKIFGFFAGAILLGLTFPYTSILGDYMIPVSALIMVISLLSFLSNLDAKKVKFAKKLGLTNNVRKASLELAYNTNNITLQKFSITDINFAYNMEKNIIYWKEGANKLYQRLVPIVGNLIGISTDIKETVVLPKSQVEVIKDREELKKKIEEGINLQHEEGIKFRGEISSVSEDSGGVKVEVDEITSATKIDEDYDSIKTIPEIKQNITGIKIEPEIKQTIEPIKTESSIKKDIQPIETKTSPMVRDDRGYIGELTDVDTIPIPKELPGYLKSSDKKSVKELKTDEKEE